MLVGDGWAAVVGPEGAQGLGHSLPAESPVPLHPTWGPQPQWGDPADPRADRLGTEVSGARQGGFSKGSGLCRMIRFE